MKLINRYIAKRVFKAILVAFIIITGIIMLVDFVETSRDLGGDIDVNMVNILGLTALNAPMLVEQTIPFVVLFGVMGALFSLNRHSELIVLRAAGLSAWRFLIPAVIVSFIIGVIWTLAFNPLAAMSQNQRNTVLKQINPDAKNSKIINKPLWLREGREQGHIVIHAKRADIDNHILYDVTFYEFENNASGKEEMTSRYDAAKAKLLDGFWEISNVTENEVGKAATKYMTISRETSIVYNDLRDSINSKRKPPFWQLSTEIKKAKKAGYDPTRLIMRFNKLLSLPLTLVAMTIIAAAASLNLSRSGGTIKLLILGSMLGFGVFFLDNLIGAFGETGTLPPALAAWSIPLFVLASGLSYLSWIEDG